MNEHKPFNKDIQTKIPFSEMISLIGETCDYKFCIIDDIIDDELMALAAEHGIDLTGFKHVIETTGIKHAEKRHGQKSNNRNPLLFEDYLLIPYIIRNRDSINISTSNTRQHKTTVLVYEKQIGQINFYVEEIRSGEKTLPSKPCTNEKRKTPLCEGLFCYRGGYIFTAAPLRLDNQFIFHSVSATNCLQSYK